MTARNDPTSASRFFRLRCGTKLFSDRHFSKSRDGNQILAGRGPGSFDCYSNSSINNNNNNNNSNEPTTKVEEERQMTTTTTRTTRKILVAVLNTVRTQQKHRRITTAAAQQQQHTTITVDYYCGLDRCYSKCYSARESGTLRFVVGNLVYHNTCREININK